MKRSFRSLSSRHFLTQGFTSFLIILASFAFKTTVAYAQIYEPEGLNMPGSYNDWNNPPTLPAFASATQAGGQLARIAGGINRYQTIFEVDGTNLSAGPYDWLFTSGSTSNNFANKWANVNVVTDQLQTYTFNNGANNSITLAAGNWYTMNWEDKGYEDTRAIFMETASEPVSLSSLSVPTNIVTNQEAEITLTISAVASTEEIFYLRYTNDNWTNSAVATFYMTGISGTANIPSQAEGKTINYYAFSSTVNGITTDYDLYTIKAATNGGSNYSYTVAGLSSDAEILTFSLTEQTGAAVINSAAATVDIEVENGTALANLTPTITVSENANISPAGGTAQDFSTPFDYTVTAEDLTEKVWTVTVTEAAPPAPNYGLRDDEGTNLPTITYWYSGQSGDITEKGSEFNYKALGELTALYIKGANIKSWKSVGGDVSGAKFSYKIWESTDSEPSIYTERAVNWSSNDGDGNQSWADFGTEIEATLGLAPGNYNFKIFFSISGSGLPGTTEDGPFTASFFVPEPASSDAEILTFTLAEQTGAAVINSAAATVDIEVENGTALANLTPTITVSENANISPAGGTAQDFSTPFDYTVTAEDLTEKVWTVTVTEAALPAPNYGLRDDGGVNLPTIKYWYSGQSGDITEKGSEFNYKALGELTALYIKGANIKSWKSVGGDVSGAKFSYKIWESTDSEPSIYTERAVNWSSNDGDGNQSWADFGTEIEATLGLAPGNYNFKIFFSISGSGLPGTTEDGPFTASFFVPEPASSDAEILTFSLTEQTGAAVINSAAATVDIEVENGTALTNLTPTITVSENANISPAGGTAQDFSAPFDYTVTAEDLTEKVWTVTVTEAAPPAPNYGLRDDEGTNLPTITYWYSGQSGDITEKGSEFNYKALGELTALYIKGANIKSWKSAGGDVTGATFNYKIWESTDSEPSIYTERAVNWSSNDGDGNQSWADFGTEIEATLGLAPGNYNFKIFFSISGSGLPGTTEDGPFTASFFVPEPASSDAEILTFTLAEQTGAAVINSAAATVDIEVENGTALANLTPTITVSENANISPAGGTAQDFSTPFDYTVTAEDLTEKVWTVTVTEAAPPAPNYGLRDDEGTNLPTITYWYSGQSGDITEKGSEFNYKALGELTSLYIKGANIKSWKSAGGDVSGATFSYKIWESTDSEPSIYTERAVNWSSNDGDGNQSWADFGTEIEATLGLAPGNYNFKIFFSISGSGLPGTTEDGPFTASFFVPEPASSDAEILTFSLTEQTGAAVINSAAATVAIEVENGTALTNLTPTISLSANATISPAGGTAQDFSTPFDYTVTAEDLTEKVWTVTVTEAAPPTALTLPYSNGLRTLSAYNQLLTDGFTVENSDYITAAGGYIKIFNGGYVETPLIDFTAYGILEISFSSTTFGGVAGQTMAIEISENGGGSYTQLTTYTLTSSYSSYEYLLDLSGYPSQTGKLRFKMISGTNATRFRDLSLEESIPDPEIGFANLQYPASGAIEPLQEFNVYAQAWIENTTGSGTATADLQAWIGYSTDNTNPNTWTNWIEADFQGINGNNDEFFANLGGEMTTEGVFYYASRFKYLSQDYVYGGFNGGFWDGVDNVSGVLTVAEVIETYPVLFTVTDGTESYSAIEIKGSMTDWATLAMTENPDHVWTISLDIPAGTYEWGAIENDGSDDGIWLIDGGNLSFVVSETGVITGTVSYTIPALPADPEIGFANLQYPASGAIEPLQEFNVYAQAWIENTTGSGTATADLQAWIGYSTDNTNPNTWTNWIEADFQGINGNNDEFFANLGGEMTSEGVFYYASRFKYLSQDYVYGGFNGGFWDGVDNVSGVLTVTEVIVTYPVLFTVTDGTESYQTIEIKGSMTDWATLAMTESPDHVWTISLDIPAGTYEWGAIENDGSDDGIWLIEGGNLSFVVSETGVITGTVSYTIPALPADPEIGFANLQYPASGAIEPLQEFNVYAQAYIDGITGSGIATAGLQSWIGYSTDNTNPNTWTNWIEADFQGINGNNDEFFANLGGEMTTEGTFYYASRFKYLEQDYVYGGFNGGFWDGVDNVSGVLTVTTTPPDPEITFANLQFPASASILISESLEVYAQVEASGVALDENGYDGLTVWIGYSSNDTDPTGWTNWYAATYNGISGFTNRPEYLGEIGSDIAQAGTYYYASRFQLSGDNFVYGGFDGGFWDGVNNVSGVLTVTEETTDPVIGFANLQWPASGTIEPLQEFNVYAQAWIENTTGSGTATSGLQSWIGYSTDNTNPNTWTNWIEADFSSAQGNNDEFFANLGAEMTSEGIFYYASRFKYLNQDYVYGGFDGGFWDGVDNISGVLTVTTTPPDPEITFANLQFPASASILIGESLEVYAQVEASGVTLDENGYDGLTVWIGYSSDDTDPASWTSWYAADYNGISGFTNRPEYLGEIGSDIAQAGIYYYASRFQLSGGNFVYGGFDGGFWDGVNNVSGVLTVTEETTDPVIGFANLQWPASGTIEPLQEFNVYAQAWIENTTGSGTATAGLQAWIGYSTDNTNPNTWTNWIEADFQGVNGNNDEFFANLGAEMTTEGVFYYASRFKYLSQDYVYGGFNGGFWDGVNNVSGVLTVTEETTDPVISFANLQWPASGTIEPLQEFNVYAQAWIENTTGSGTATADLQAWIGYSTDNTNPNTWTNWIEADFQGVNGNNDEFFANLGGEMTSEGTFYYASRFKYLEQDYVYGGFNGGFWDGVDNVSGVLTVTTTPPDPEITFANLQFPASASILIGGNVDVYAQVEASGVALDENGYDGLTVWIGYSSNDTDPTGWTNWYATTYNGISGFTNRPEYLGEIGSDIAQAGTYYYASRFQLSGGNFVYGGFDGGFWDGVNNVSGVLTVTEETTDPVIGFANLQWPASGTIEPLQEFNVYAQAWIENTTGSGTATADLQSWIGYSTDNTNPNTWTNWIEADFQGINGNNDEFFANLGGEMTSEGTFYYASRFKYLSQDYVYGGFNGGFWDGVDNVSGVLTVTTTPPDPEITFANLQFPASASILISESLEVYAQVEASGVALDENGYDGLTVWIGYSSNDTDPTGWTNWYATTYNGISGFTNRPEYLGEIGSDIAQAGTYYYASRFQLSGGNFVYGGFDGGFWDGVNNVSGVLTVTEETPELEIGWANLQWPPAGLIEPGDEFIVYAQAWIQNTTGSGTATENLQSWIGYSTDNTDPATWTNWIEADYNAAVGSNDEFMANLGAELSAEGTYYYASRFQYLDQAFVYGGFSEAGGGFWDGVDYVSGQLVVVNEVVLYPITFTATDATGLYSNIKFKGEMTNWETVPMEQNGENWTLSFDILPGTYEWGLIEDDGSPDGIWLIEGPNLEVSISAEGVITGDTTYVITYVGLEEMQADVKIYPNPTKNRLYLEFSQAGDFELQLFDTKGQLINRLQSAETRLMLPVQNLEPGMYVIRIISDKALITKTFIKQ